MNIKELLLAQLQTYSNTVNSLQQELIELDRIAKEKNILLEQNKGAYNAIALIALEQGIIDQSGRVIENNINSNDNINNNSDNNTVSNVINNENTVIQIQE